MIQLMNDLPAYVAAFTASGAVTKEDYEKVLIPKVEEVSKTHGHIHFLFEIRTDVDNFTVGAWWKDLAVGFKQFSNWKKMAIVSNQDMVNKISTLLSPIMPGTTKGFSADRLEEAKQWVSAE